MGGWQLVAREDAELTAEEQAHLDAMLRLIIASERSVPHEAASQVC